MTQLALPLEQTTEFKRLTKKLDAFDTQLEQTERTFKFILDMLKDKRREILHSVQDECIHPDTTEDVFVNGHNGDEDWTETCDICGKVLRHW